MQPEDRDLAYLWDMLDAAKTVVEFVKGIKFHEYEKDRKLQLAVERVIEIIGEAARNVSKEFQDAHPNIPWRGIIGQRHMLAHEYGEIKQERLWLVISERIPELIKMLAPLVPESVKEK
jgi:uncharacterized protein with HEPN domain